MTKPDPKRKKDVVKRFKKKAMREWLNGPSHYDSGFYKLTQTGELRWRGGDVTKKPDFYVDMCLTIADCSKQIHLNFDCLSKSDINVRLKKIRKLREVLNEMENTFLQVKDESIFK